MNRSIGIFGLRLFALFLVVLSLQQLPTSSSITLIPTELLKIEKYSLYFVAYGPPLAYFLSGLALWIFAGKLVRFLVIPSQDGQELNTFDLASFGALLVALIGIAVVVTTIPELFVSASNVITSYRDGVRHAVSTGALYLIKTIIQLLLGVGLFVGRKAIVKLVNQ